MAQHVTGSRPTTQLSAAAAQGSASDKRGVQKGFLKQARLATSAKGSADMKIDERNHFAFIGFPLDTDP